MTVGTRRYVNVKNLGDCPKCGDKGTIIQWKKPWLGATCNRCGIKWPINARDECGEQERHHMTTPSRKYREDFDTDAEYISQVPDERLDHSCVKDCRHWSHWYGVASRAQESFTATDTNKEA